MMKQKKPLVFSLLMLILTLTVLCVPVSAADIQIHYVTDGLAALYEGSFNTLNGQDKSSGKWYDVSGNGNHFDLTLSEKCTWTDQGLAIDSQKIILPETVLNLINGESVTVEMVLDEFVPKGKDFNTFLNNDQNDNFSLFIRVSNGELEFKNAGNTRPKAANGRDLVNGHTVTVTFRAGGSAILYSDGQEVAKAAAASRIGAAGNFFIGHDEDSRNYSAVVKSLRFYSRDLTPEEVAANANVTAGVTLNNIDTGDSATAWVMLSAAFCIAAMQAVTKRAGRKHG